MLVRVWRNELSYIASWNVKWYSHPEKSLVVSLKKKKNTLTLGSSSYTPRHLSQRNKNLCLHKNLYTNVYSTFICKSRKLAVSKMSFIGPNGAHVPWSTTQYKRGTNYWCMEQFEWNLKGECWVKESALKVSDSTYWAQGLFGVFSTIFRKIHNLLKEQN